jgi:hypothetical protein
LGSWRREVWLDDGIDDASAFENRIESHGLRNFFKQSEDGFSGVVLRTLLSAGGKFDIAVGIGVKAPDWSTPAQGFNCSIHNRVGIGTSLQDRMFALRLQSWAFPVLSRFWT